jgi:hypothetical protein
MKNIKSIKNGYKNKFLFILFVVIFCQAITINTFAASGIIINHPYEQKLWWESTTNQIILKNTTYYWGDSENYDTFRASKLVFNSQVIFQYPQFPMLHDMVLTIPNVPNKNHFLEFYNLQHYYERVNFGNVFVTAYTDNVAPNSPTYTNIKHDRVTVNIDRGINSLDKDLQIKIYRSTSPAGPWTLVHTGTSTVQNYTFTATGLVADTTYYFYATATNDFSGNTPPKSSPVSSVMTTSDPTLAAVEAAKGAAEVASAKAIEAVNKVDSITGTINNIQNELTTVKNEVQNLDINPPAIKNIRFTGGKTITTSSTENIFFNLSDDKTPQNQISIRALVNGNPTSWTTGTTSLQINLVNGLNQITIEAKDIKGNTAYATTKIWKK